MTRNEKRTLPGAKSESPATTVTSSPGRLIRDPNVPTAPAPLGGRPCVPQPAATSATRAARRNAPAAFACDPARRTAGLCSSVRLMPGGKVAAKDRDSTCGHGPECSPGPAPASSVWRPCAGLAAVEHAAAVERAAAVEHAARLRSAAVEHAGELRRRMPRRVLRLSETRERPHSSGKGTDYEDEPRLFHIHLLSLEPDVLECFRRPAIELGCSRVLATLGGKVATSHPGCGLMADGLELLGAGIRRGEVFLGLVQAPLVHQRPTQHELRRSDVIEEVLAVLHEGERVTCLLLSRARLARHQVHVGERCNDVRRLRVAALVEQHAVRVLQMLDRLLGLAEMEVQATEVVEQTADVSLVVDLLVVG